MHILPESVKMQDILNLFLKDLSAQTRKTDCLGISLNLRWVCLRTVVSFCFVFLRPVYPILPVSLDCPFFLLPLRYIILQHLQVKDNPITIITDYIMKL